jgi:hypothetical protein
LHTDPSGSYDLPDNPLSRRYYLSGLQHGGGTQSTKTSTGVCQNYNNPLDDEYTDRALWVALDKYITKGVAPPPSQVPTLSGGTLISSLSLQFPSGYQQTVTGINGGNPFPVLYTGLETTRYRFNMGQNFYQTWVPTINPPVITPPFEDNPENGPIYPSYVPQVNVDGNDVTGILMPEIQVPLATYMGWNYRSGSSNAPTPQNDGPDGCESTGSYIPFYGTMAARNTAGDPRLSVTERYTTYANYLSQVTSALDSLVRSRFMLCGPDISAPLALNGGGGEMANLVADWAAIPGAPSTGGLSPPVQIPACAVAHDFNGDGYSDILWSDTSGDLAIWEMNGGTVLNPSTSGLGTVPAPWAVVGQRDFNGDGYADILWRNTSTGDVAIWEMNGTTILNPSTSGLGTVATAWSIVGTGDFNGDGYADILWRNTSTGDLSIWEMNGTTIINPSSTGLGNVPLNWTVVGVGDFNGDGKADILWRDTAGDLSIWLMNGTTILNPNTSAVGNMPTSWFVAGTGDFNGDGNSDILWQDTSGDIAIWEMNGTAILNPNTAGVGNLSTVWSVAETGDFDGNGMSDILWRDTSGDIAIWFMNGTTIASGTGLGTIPTTYTIQGTNAD